ncbi:unnamed protein product [Cochlearia groenlandica]
MRAGLSTIQQTLTPDAATVLNQSISEASRRNHGQTTPLHVAATLLASPTGFLRRACIRSHPNSSHPLQCRALELCFSVALERLPTSAAATTANQANDPPISNALMAALKRAQAHQRRGCPEQQQQPLLAVKVELEQLIISILDDPSVSRVMREASFSSPAVKATIEQTLTNSPTNPAPISSVGINFRPGGAPMTRNSYLNPRLQQNASAQSGESNNNKNDDVERVVDILGRAKKKNPVLVGDTEPGRVIIEILKRIESGEIVSLKNSKIVRLDEIESDKASRIGELDGIIETRLNSKPDLTGGVILDLGDLKWLVEQSSATQPPITQAVEVGRSAVAELRRLTEKFKGRLWLIGTATCETFLRCQVYHPSMETDLDLQAVSVAAKSPAAGVFPRSVVLANNLGSFTPLKSLVPENKKLKCCTECSKRCEREISEIDSMSPEVKPEPKQLPQWLMKAKPDDHQAKIEQVHKKWNDACARLHPSFHNKNERIVPVPVPITLTTGSYGPNMLLRQPLQPKLHPNRELRKSVHSKPMSALVVAEQAKKKSPPGSPVQTDLVLGRAEDSEKTGDLRVRDFLGCISSESVHNNDKILQKANLENSLDIDLFKKLLKGMAEKVWWQHDAASAVAATVSQCKLGTGKRRGVLSKGDVWLLFSGPDRVGKRKMVSALSTLVCGTNPTMIQLGSRQDGGDGNHNIRGKTVLDRIAETVKRSPFSVILLEDIDEADMLLRGSIKRAMDRGRISDSHGREISLGNVIFVMTASWHSAAGIKPSSFSNNEAKLRDLANESWRLRLCVREKFGKRRASWLCNEEERLTKPKKEHGSSGLSIDLNQAADTEDGLHNTSDLTSDNEQEEEVGFSGKLSLQCVPFAFHDLVSRVDDAVAFRAVDFGAVRRKISDKLSEKFARIVGESLSIEVEDEALQRILSGVWLGQTELDEWIEKTIVPVLSQLKARVSAYGGDRTVARLELDEDSGERNVGDLLPTSITLAV